MQTLSVVIITKNEAQHLPRCLAALHWVDEIIIVDSGSTDNTADIAQLNPKVRWFEHPWQGFGLQKQFAVNQATGQWILSIDADEVVPEALAQEIQRIIQQPHHATLVYALPRRSWYCGRWIHHSGWSPDYVTRLFERGSAQFTDDTVHEHLKPCVTPALIGRLTTPLLHYSFVSAEQVLHKMNHYSSLSAQAKFAKGQPSSLGKALLHGLWAFIRTYIVQRGFLDGSQGVMLAISNAEGTYYRYVKLWLLQHNLSAPSLRPDHMADETTDK
jgi:glycosyltransferase involved in cell wall biosynthesis